MVDRATICLYYSVVVARALGGVYSAEVLVSCRRKRVGEEAGWGGGYLVSSGAERTMAIIEIFVLVLDGSWLVLFLADRVAGGIFSRGYRCPFTVRSPFAC